MTGASGFTARQRAALPGSGYDRLVAVLKLALPLAAATLLGVIIIWPLTSVREFSFLLAKDKVGVSNDRLRDYVQDRLAGVISRPDGHLVPGPDVA